LYLAVWLIVLACAAAFIYWFGRRNWLAYALVLWLFAVRGPLLELLGNGNSSLDIQGWIAGFISAGLALWVIAPAIGRRTAGNTFSDN
jgi:hypothetical protein